MSSFQVVVVMGLGLFSMALGEVIGKDFTKSAEEAEPAAVCCDGDCLTEQAVIALVEKHCKSCECDDKAPSGLPQEPEISENEVLEVIEAPVVKKSSPQTCVGGNCKPTTYRSRGLFGWRR